MRGVLRTLLAAATLSVFAFPNTASALSTVSGSFTDNSGNARTWSASVDTGITLTQQFCCTLPGNQGDGTIKNFVNTAFGTSFAGNNGKDDLSNVFTVSWTGSDSSIFAIHVGGKGGGSELLIQLSALTSVFDFTINTGKKFGALSSLQGFGIDIPDSAPPPAPTPLPATLPMLLAGLGGLGWFARRKKKLAAA